MPCKAVRIAAVLLACAGATLFAPPASAEKLTIALAGKGMSFILQYVAIGGGFYKQEGLDPDPVDVASGTRQAAAVMGGSAEITQVGFAHTIHAVGRGGSLVAISTSFDMYPIALVVSNAALKRLGVTDDMSLDEKLKRLHGIRIGITSPGSSTDEFMRTIMLVRHLNPDQDMHLQPIGIGAPMVAAMQQGSTDGFAFMSPFTDIAVSRGLGKVLADPMQNNVPEYRNVPYQVITTSRDTLAAKRPLLLRAVRAMTRAMIFTHEKPDEARKIVRSFFPDTPEPEFNAAFNNYVHAVPTTPVVSQQQVESTIAMVNLSEKTPIKLTMAQVVDNSLAEQALKEVSGK